MSSVKISKLLPKWLTHSAVYSVVVIDMEGKYLFVNDCFSKRFSFLRDDFIGTDFKDTVHPEDIEKCNNTAYQCIQDPSGPKRVQIRKPNADKVGYHLTDWEFSPLFDDTGALLGVLSIGHDITEKEQRGVTIDQQNEKLKAIAWQQSHELRSPLVNILGCIQVIRDKRKLVSGEEEDELFELISSELTHLDRIIHKIVSVSKPSDRQ